MSEDQNNSELTLKDLIIILIEQWKFILSLVFISTVFAVIYNFFVAIPVYQTEAELFMTIPESKVTEAGTYNYPSSNAKDYFDLFYNDEIVDKTIKEFELDDNRDSFISRFSINQEEDSSLVSIAYRSSDINSIATVVDGHILNFQRYLSYEFRKDAISQFITEGKVTLSLKEDQLTKQEEQLIATKLKLNDLSQTIPLQKALTSNSELAAKYSRDTGIEISDLSNHLLIEEVINENYMSTLKFADNLELSNENLKVEIQKLKEMLELLDYENSILKSSDKFEESTSEFLSVLSSTVKQIASANVPNNRIAPKRTTNVALAIIVSFMISVIVVFFRAYWNGNLK